MTMSDDDLAKLKREVQIETESGSRIKKIMPNSINLLPSKTRTLGS